MTLEKKDLKQNKLTYQQLIVTFFTAASGVVPITGATLTAPVDGEYVLDWSCIIRGTANGTLNSVNDNKSGLSRQLRGNIGGSGVGIGCNASVSFNLTMTAGETVSMFATRGGSGSVIIQDLIMKLTLIEEL